MAIKNAVKVKSKPWTAVVVFNVQGHVKQRVEITDPTLTPERLRQRLEAGEIFTTIQEGGQIEEVATGRVVGRVRAVDNECEYEDFAVEMER